MSPRESSSPTAIFLLPALLVTGAVLGAGLYYYRIPVIVGYLAGLNLATMALYGYDKAVAGGQKLRVPEKVLHLLALLGGSPAAFLSQSLFRHKTVKTSFRRMFWLIVVLQIALAGAAVWWWRRPG